MKMIRSATFLGQPPRQSFATRQQRRVLSQANDTDAHGFFNLLIGREFLEDVEELLPEHRERLFPPTESLSMFMAQALSADGSCKQDNFLFLFVLFMPSGCSSSTSSRNSSPACRSPWPAPFSMAC